MSTLDEHGFPVGHRVMRATDPDPAATKRNPKRYVVFSEWECECGERVTSVMTHRIAHGMPDPREFA